MIDSQRLQRTSGDEVEELDELLERISAQIDAGETIDLSVLLRKHPQHADQLQRLVPTMLAIADLGHHAAASPSAPTGDVPGEVVLQRTLGDFHIIRELGRGGMGVVYEAEQISLGRQVALKVLPFASLLDKRQLERFKNEARAAAMLKHPHIVSVFQTGCERGVHYYAMELVNGQTLAEVIDVIRGRRSVDANGQLRGANELAADRNSNSICSISETSPLATLTTSHARDRDAFYRFVARLGIQAAEALQYAHKQGVIHRDIKPSNFLLDEDAKLWVSDFGLAQIEGGPNLTMTGDVIGTMRYMSPEQARGNTFLDQRADIYSLGLTLFELLTLRPAYGEKDRQRLLRQIADQSPVAPRSIDRSIPRNLETIVLKAINKDASARYGSADEVAADLKRFIEHRPIRARRTTWVDRVSHWGRRNPYLAVLLTLVVVLLGAIAVSSTLESARRQEEAEARREQAYESDMNRVPSMIEKGEFLRAIAVLDNHRPVGNQSDLRGMEWYLYRRRCEAATCGHTLTHHWFVYCGEYSPDGKVLATTGQSRRIRLWSTDGYHEIRSITPVADHARVIFRNDNELISVTDSGVIELWNIHTGDHARPPLKIGNELRRSGPQAVRILAIDPGGNTLAVGFWEKGKLYPTSRPGRVAVWDLSSGRHLATLEDGLTGAIGVSAFSADGQRLIAGDEAGVLRMWSTTDWTLDREVAAHAEGVFSLAVSPDGKWLATGSGVRYGEDFDAGEINIWDTTTWKRTHQFTEHDDRIRSLAFSLDGNLAAASFDGDISLWNVDEGMKLLAFRGHVAEVVSVRFSPDHGYVCTTSLDSTARVWKVRELIKLLPEWETYRHHQAMITNVEFLDGGRKVCTMDRYSRFQVWDADTQQIETSDDQAVGSVADMDISPDEQFLVVASGGVKPQKDGMIRLLQLSENGAPVLWNQRLKKGFWRGIEFSPDGSVIALGSGTELLILSSANGNVLAKYGPLEGAVLNVRFSRSGDKLACTTTGGSTHVLAAIDYHRIFQLKTDGGASYCAEFTPDERHLLTGGSDNVIRMWDADSGKLSKSFDACTSAVSRIRVTPDGSRVISVTITGTVQIWRPESGASVFTARDQGSHLCVTLALTRDGLRFASGAGAMRLWRVPRPDTDFHPLTADEKRLIGYSTRSH